MLGGGGMGVRTLWAKIPNAERTLQGETPAHEFPVDSLKGSVREGAGVGLENFPEDLGLSVRRVDRYAGGSLAPPDLDHERCPLVQQANQAGVDLVDPRAQIIEARRWVFTRIFGHGRILVILGHGALFIDAKR